MSILKLKTMKTIGFIGGGRVTRILLKGFKNAMLSFDQVQVYDTNEQVLSNLKSEFPSIGVSNSDPTKAASSDTVFISLHPPVLMESLQIWKSYVKKDALIVSLAPKIAIEKLQSVLTQTSNLARMNPNAGTYANKGFNPVCFAEKTDKQIIKNFVELFEKLGKVPIVAENQIEAYAVVSAMGHTYFWFQLQHLKELALSYGLSECEAKEAITSMLWGTTETLFNSGLKYEDVLNLVPVKPMAEHENAIKEFYSGSLNAIFQKIKP
jgi:pyrroline-5-carboxylate reductase